MALPPDPNRPKGRKALTALEQGSALFCYPQDAADVLGKNLKTTYDAIKRGEIPAIKIGQRYSISIAWLRRTVDGLDYHQPARRARGAA